MSINRLISINNPIINAMDLAAVDHANHRPLFMTWAYQAEKEIGSYYQYERQWKVIDVCGCTAEDDGWAEGCGERSQVGRQAPV